MLSMIAASLVALISAQEAPTRCSDIPEPTERLACYDQAAGVARADSGARADYRRDQWLVAFGVDANTDADTVGLAVVADQISTSGRPPTLLFRCIGGTLTTLIDWDTSIRSDDDDETVVTIQIDAQRAEATDWRVSADGTATYAPDGRHDAVLSSLYFAQRLIARVTPEDEPTRTAGFNVSGLLDVAPAIWDACPPR